MKNLIVVPCFDEENRLPIKDFEEFIRSERSVDFLFVNDGSRDNTLAVLNDLCNKHRSRVSILNLDENQGKANAIRSGILSVKNLDHYKYLGYLDADLAVPLDQITKLAKALERNSQIDFVFGSRISMLGNSIIRNPWRHYSGRVIATFISIELGVAVYDTQCGIKVFRSRLGEHLFNEEFISRWLFDVELFHRLKKESSNLSRIAKEIPLDSWLEKGNSKIRLSDILKLPYELFRIHKEYDK